MTRAGAVLLAGGRSSRMGTDKAGLDWHGSPLLVRVAGVLLRAVPGPVLVVRAAGRPLPALPARVEVLDDPVPGLGPLAGLATGLAGLAGSGTTVAFACSTDLPFLHPALVRTVLAALGPDQDAAAPELEGRLQPLAAGYRTGLAALAGRLLRDGERRATALLRACRARPLGAADLLADPELAALDPELRSLLNVNRPEEYRRALAAAAPTVGWADLVVRAHTLGQAAAAAGTGLDRQPALLLNGLPVPADPDLPLVAGDRVTPA